MAFVNVYALPQAGRFRKTVPGRPRSRQQLAIGATGRLGLATCIDEDSGAVTWARTYDVAERALELIDAAAIGREGFALLGGISPLKDKAGYEAYLLMRIDAAGTPAWARRLEGGQGLARLLYRPDKRGEIVVALRPKLPPAPTARELADIVRMRPDGTHIGTARLRLAVAGHVFDAALVKDGYVLVGDALAAGGAKERVAAGLVVHVDTALSACRAWLPLRSTKESPPLSFNTVAAGREGGIFTAGAARAPGADGANGIIVRMWPAATGLAAPTIAAHWPLEDPGQQPVAITSGVEVLLGIPPVLHGSVAALVRFDTGLKVNAACDFTADARILGLGVRSDPGAIISGSLVRTGTPEAPQLLVLDPTLACCRTVPRKLESRRLPVKAEQVRARLAPLRNEPARVRVAAGKAEPRPSPLCGVSVGWPGERKLQSPNLVLLAAGSDGSDASEGILLRWLFGGALAKHLPKGDAAAAVTGFDKPDDVVRLWRAPWPASVPRRRLSLATDRPAYVDTVRRVLAFDVGPVPPRDLFAISFPDAAAFATAAQAADPSTDPAAFVTAYGAHPIEIELRNRISLGCDLAWAGAPGATIDVEVCGVAENVPLAAKHVVARRVIPAAASGSQRLLADNLRSLRLRLDGASLGDIAFICYDDILDALDAGHAWIEVGAFALPPDDQTAFERLEDPARFEVHGKWHKFNDSAFVNVQNYRDRWTSPTEGIALAVQAYLQAGPSNPLAMVELPGAKDEDGMLTISRLDVLNLLACDYHVARMLGLGCVDPEPRGSGSWIYLAEYRTEADLSDGKGARAVQNLALSLPTRIADARLPLVPELDGVEYGLEVATASGAPYPLTDADGYTPDGLARYIRLYPGCEARYAPETGFFDPAVHFDLSANSLPLFYGVEFRAQGEAQWRRPEIAHDPLFTDTAAKAEVVVTPFPAKQRDRAFVHRMSETGSHEYAGYSVNLFSRPSGLSQVRGTTPTSFRRRNTLLPPTNLLVQLVQPENPLVLTSQTEQDMLANLTGDPTLVRLCFTYGFVQDLAYDYADTLEIFHRAEPPRTIDGGLTAIDPDADPALLRLSIGPYAYASSGTTAQPSLSHSLAQNFRGGVVVAGGQRLIIEDVQWPSSTSPDNPIFVVRRPSATGAYYDPATGSNAMTVEPADPVLNPGDLVLAIENLAVAGNWGSIGPLARKIIIAGTDWTDRVESFPRSDGGTTTRRLRGLLDTAWITPTGSNAYKVEFDNKNLAPHPQSADAEPVNWWRGMLFAPVVGRDPRDRRALAVVAVDTSQVRLVLHVVDDSGQPGSVDHGAGRQVNYYPGYRVHLLADPAHGFDQSTLYPTGSEMSRRSLIGLRAVDHATLDSSGDPYRSRIGVPQILIATASIDPLTPYIPAGMLYAAPPDSDGKSSYTLTLTFQHDPFAVVVYRADALSILKRVYDGQPAALAQAVATLFPPDNVPFTDLFNDLLAFLDDSRPALSPFPPTGPDSVTLPVPAGASDKAALKEEVLSAFVPLTEQPLVWERIRNDPAYVPTNRKQRYMDEQGNPLDPNLPSSGFDLAPMAKRLAAAYTMMFTDFTLDGSMNPDTLWFYHAREIGDRMKLGDPSPVFGPVRLVNLNPAAAPVVRKIDSFHHDVATGAGPQVRFELLPPRDSDPMAWLRIYRTSDPAAALSTRTMTARPDIDLAGLTPTPDGTLVVADDFAGELFVPFGDPLFYRLAWVRDVAWEDAGGPRLTQVASEPTRAMLANVIDVLPPTPPTPSFSVLAIDGGSGAKYLRMSWPPTTYNGIYFVERMSTTGVWTRIGTVQSNDSLVTFDLPDPLAVAADDGQILFHRIRIQVEGPSGLVNAVQHPVTIRLDTIN